MQTLTIRIYTFNELGVEAKRAATTHVTTLLKQQGSDIEMLVVKILSMNFAKDGRPVDMTLLESMHEAPSPVLDRRS
jgi:hypothetical protein